MPAASSPRCIPVHAHGAPNWIDLHTAEVDTARAFYDALLGWTFRNRFTLTAVPDQPTPVVPSAELKNSESPEAVDPNSTTVMAMSGHHPVAEFVERSSTYGPMDLVSSWSPYIYVSDLQATLALVEPAGGLVLSPPARRGDLAIVATILDPNDALLCLWEPVEDPGCAVMHQPGALTWLELETSDLDSARKFYGELFGWNAGEVTLNNGVTEQEYTVFTKGGDRVAGAVESAMDQIHASWCPSFAVADVDAAIAISTRCGGVLLAEPMDIPVGCQASIVDPTGASFSVLGPKVTGPRPL